MTTEKMTIHKALCELKTLDARITKCIGETEYVFANKHSNDKVNGMTVAAYCDEIKSGYQRVTDLIKRRDAIKRAVVLSNAVTKVTVGGKEYTVAEAIEMKTTVFRCCKRCSSDWSGITVQHAMRQIRTMERCWRCVLMNISNPCMETPT